MIPEYSISKDIIIFKKTMDKIYLLQVNRAGYRFISQLTALINGLIYAYHNNARVVVVKSCDEWKINEVIDLDKFNTYLESRLGLKIYDHSDLIFKLVSVRYGTYDKVIDITDSIRERFMTGSDLFVPKHIVFNDIKGDPAPNQYKKILFKFLINKTSYEVMYNESLPDDISFNKFKVIESSDQVNKFDPDLFIELIQNLSFLTITNNFASDTKINALHIRNDPDMIYYWGTVNKMLPFEFKDLLNQKYIELIDNFFDKETTIIVSTYDRENEVIQFLKNEGYTYYISDTEIINPRCNSIFIGNHGSMTTYFMQHRLAPTVQKILINLYDIHDNIIIDPE